MPRVPVDFSEVQEFEPLEKGEYPAVIEKITFVDNTDPEKYPYLNVELTLTEVAEGQSSKAWVIWSLSPKALFRMKGDFENLGLDTEAVMDIDYDEDTMLVTEPELTGMPVVLVCDKPRVYEGRAQTNVSALIAPDGAPAQKKSAPARRGASTPRSRSTAAGAKKKFK